MDALAPPPGAALPQPALIDAANARARHQSGATLIDVRTPAEFAAVHAVGALSLPLERLDPLAALAALDVKADQPLLILCQAGGRARQAQSRFAAAGFARAVVVEGGTNAWIAAGMPVERGKAVMSLERQVRIGAGALVLIGVILGFTVHPYCFGLSGFVGAGLVFAGLTDTCAMGILIARMPWNQRAAACANAPGK